MSKIINFPKRRETVVIKELDSQKYKKKLDFYLDKGYEVIRASSLFKKTRFGGVTSYFAELLR